MDATLLINRWRTSEAEAIKEEVVAFLIQELPGAEISDDPDEMWDALFELTKQLPFYEQVLDNKMIDLRGIELSDIKIRNKNLQQVDFSFSTLKNCEFTDVDFFNAQFIYSSIESCVFKDVILDAVNFQYVEAINCSLTDAHIGQLTGMQFSLWEDCSFTNSLLHIECCNTTFKSSVFANMSFDIKGKIISFIGSDLKEADLSNQVRWSDLDFSSSNLENANFQKSNLTGGIFTNTNLKNTDFSEAYIMNASFDTESLSSAFLEKSKNQKFEIE